MPLAFVQSKTTDIGNTAQTNVAATLSNAVNLDDLIVVFFGTAGGNSNESLTSIGDGTNTYHLLARATNATGWTVWMHYAFAVAAASAGSLTITAVFGSSDTFNFMIASEYSGVQFASDPLDVFSGWATSASGSPTVSATTSNANDVIVAGFIVNSGESAGSGYTSRGDAVNASAMLEDAIVSSAGSQTATGGGTASWLIAFGAFKQASAAVDSPMLRTQQRVPGYPPRGPIPGVPKLGVGPWQATGGALSPLSCTMAAVGTLSGSLVDIAAPGLGSLPTQRPVAGWRPPLPIVGVSQLGTGLLEPNPSIPGPMTATFAGTGALAATLTGSGALADTMAAVGALSAFVQDVAAPGLGALPTQRPIAGWRPQLPITGIPQLGSGVLNPFFAGVGEMFATLNGVGALAATLTGAGALADTMNAVGALSASLAGAGAIADTMSGVGALVAYLQDNAAPGFSSLGTQMPVAGFRPPLPITGIPQLGSGVLNPFTQPPALLVVTFNGTGALAATLVGAGALADTLNGVGAMSAAATGAGALADTLNGVGALSAAATGAGALACTMSAVGALVAVPSGGASGGGGGPPAMGATTDVPGVLVAGLYVGIGMQVPSGGWNCEYSEYDEAA